MCYIGCIGHNSCNFITTRLVCNGKCLAQCIGYDNYNNESNCKNIVELRLPTSASLTSPTKLPTLEPKFEKFENLK